MNTKRKETRKAQVLVAIELFSEQNGYPPSYRDISEDVGIAHSMVHSLVKDLRTDGLIHEHHPKVSRAITLTRAGHVAVQRHIRPATEPEPASS